MARASDRYFTIAYFDRENNYRCTTEDDFATAVRTAEYLERCTVGGRNAVIEDSNGNAWNSKGQPIRKYN